MVPMPRACCAAAAAIASSRRSPGMNVDTDRRTNAVFVARSRSHRLVERASRASRARLILRIAGCGLRIGLWISESAMRNPRSAMWRSAMWRSAMWRSATSQQSLDQSAVDLHRRAGDVGRRAGKQKGADAAEVVRRAVASERDRRRGARLLILKRDAGLLRVDLVELPQAVGGDPARDERVHTDLV